MLRVDTKYAKSGMKLALPVLNPRDPSKVLLKIAYELTDEVIDKLSEYAVRTIWIKYPSLSFLEQFISPQTAQACNKLVSQVSSAFEIMQERATAKLPYHTYVRSISQLVDQLINNPKTAMYLGDISDADHDLMRHSSNVCYLSVLMGLKLAGYIVKERRHVDPTRAADVVNLGMGAMLHDVGMLLLAPDVFDRYYEFHDENDKQWREHTVLGYQKVRGHVEPSAATVVLNHHQRYNGTGFAASDYAVLEGKRIHVFARIAAVADQFDRLRQPRNRPTIPTVRALKQMIAPPLNTRFDPHIVNALFCVVPPYPPGAIVKMSDGRYAICIDHNIHDPCRPTIQFIPGPDKLDADHHYDDPPLDLSEATQKLYIAEIDGHNVADDNFDGLAIPREDNYAEWL